LPRLLTTGELERYSNCSVLAEKAGDLINQTTVFNMTGNLTSRIEVPRAEVFCTKPNEPRTVNIHVPFLSFDLAKMACDKYAMNSIIGPFNVSS
jgi:hypothetical protein